MKNNSQRNSVNNTVNNNNTNIEFTKLQGFDVLEKLPEEKIIDNYNEQFYSTLSQLKFLSVTVPDEDKLLYHFEENEEASVEATTGQVLQAYIDLFMENLNIKKIFRGIQTEIFAIFGGFENIDTTIIDDLRPEIQRLEKSLQEFLVEQKTENFRFIKEIAILQKEKEEIQKEIEASLVRLEKLEKEIGVKAYGSNSLSNTNENIKVPQRNTNRLRSYSISKGEGNESDISDRFQANKENIN
jgi:hypothetical protein